jgi:hypothetical protein
MLQQSHTSAFPIPPSHLYIFPTPDQTRITLVTSPSLAAYDLEPLAFFDGQPDGLSVRAQLIQRLPEESKIIGLVRTPEGKGLGIIRSDGGEAWRVVDKGSGLVRAGMWTAADHVVALDDGMRSFFRMFTFS